MVNSPRDRDASLEAFLLKPKLYAPLPRAEHVLRPRLLNLLTAHSEKITLIDAPLVTERQPY